MYRLEFCDDPECPEIRDGKRIFQDDFSNEFDKQLGALDRFIYLADMFRIVSSCSADLQGISNRQDSIEFWEVNKYLINYLNAVYTCKEYINSYDPPLKEVTDGYYYERKWYRFVCDYRNRVIHQSTIIKDRSVLTGDIFININEMIEVQNGVISDIKEKIKTAHSAKQKLQKQLKNAERFKQEIESLPADGSMEIKGQKFCSMTKISHEADAEISEMRMEVLKYAFQKGVSPALEWMLDHTYFDGNFYRYTFIVNKESFSCYEPTIAIESFLYDIAQSCGEKTDPIFLLLFEFLREHDYSYLYEGKCLLEDFISNQ